MPILRFSESGSFLDLPWKYRSWKFKCHTMHTPSAWNSGINLKNKNKFLNEFVETFWFTNRGIVTLLQFGQVLCTFYRSQALIIGFPRCMLDHKIFLELCASQWSLWNMIWANHRVLTYLLRLIYLIVTARTHWTLRVKNAKLCKI